MKVDGIFKLKSITFEATLRQLFDVWEHLRYIKYHIV